MKRNNKILSLITILLLIVCMTVPVSAAGKINKKKATLKVGQTLQLKVTGTKGKVKWTSSKKSVATVSSKGRVKAKKKGSATITAKVGKKKYTCKVTVKKPSTSSNGGFNGNTNTNTNTSSGKKNVVTYHAESTPYGAVAILENHYDHAVDLTVEFVYYLNGSMVGVDKDYNFAFAAHSKCALQGWNSDKTWDSFKINLNIKKASSSVITNNSGIHYSANFGNGNVVVRVDNNGRTNAFTTIAIVFYKNGRIVGYDDRNADVKNPGSTAYLEFDFPFDRNFEDIIPDKFEVYVNDSYTYSWMN